nr:hypothetical protein [Tanacetum cinerariifolium]
TEDVTFDLLQVDRRTAHFQRVGANQRIVLEHLDQVTMKRGGQTGGVVVPEQDVEHGRLVAQQV